jgi:putative aldouronate transport system permease protein
MLFYKEPVSRRIFVVINYIFLGFVSLICIFPMIHILAISLSSNAKVNAGVVSILPIEFQLNTYKFVIGNSKFYTAFFVSVERTVLGIVIDMLFTILAAYPLSMSKHKFKGREFYIWFFVVTMLFSGGLIPGYLIVKYTGLMDTIWALIIPGAVPVFNIILLQNFIKALPDEISESAFIDGAGHWTVLFKIIIPLCKPVIATLILFVAVTHWNSWFDGMLYMNRPEHYPLQTYLQTIVVQINLQTVTNLNDVKDICEENSKAAQIIVAMLPILIIYPFLQKYFTKGIILGSVKG